VRKAKGEGKSVAQKTKSAVTRLGAYRVIHFGLRGKGIKENVPMPACVVADLRARFPDTEVMHEDDADVRDAVADERPDVEARGHSSVPKRVRRDDEPGVAVAGKNFRPLS